jgi:hypothetical protein
MNPVVAQAVFRQNDPALPAPPAPPARIPEVMPETSASLNLLANRLQCSVCLTNTVNTRLNPCGHLLCSTCYMQLPEPRRCPSCRASPVTDEPIFYGGYYNKYQKYLNKLK